MTIKEQLQEVGMIAAIIADHVTKELYEKMQQKGTGYISTVETIGEWAVEFFVKHRKTNWEEVLEIGMKPLSNRMQEIICFDDAVIDFGYYKLNQFA